MTTQPSPEWNDWRWQLSHTIRSLEQMEKIPAAEAWFASLDGQTRSRLERVLGTYQMGITPYYLSLIQKFEPGDPVFAQIIPREAEATILPDELEDPIGDDNPELHTHPVRTITHRYTDRVLFHPTPICAVYCRYCFRKRLVGQAAFTPNPADIEEGVAYIAAHPEIREVIFTGGDPLILPDNRLVKIMQQVAAIEHVLLLRIHTRLPVVNPFRLTAALADGLAGLGKPVRIVTHFNHPVEVTQTAVQAIRKLIERGIPVLNQSVLLNGVNADTRTLESLLLKLVTNGIQPYYLHHSDKVRGTGHFRLSISRGREIYRELLTRLPGYAVPGYVLDIPGGYGKIPVNSDHVIPLELGKYRLISLQGVRRDYQE
ncbi:MAG: KamA family radical SAM protein [Candidatus Marinimicrobia bacterium]|nr:KamA family radical SAM protein [Candidatus Neomarinimicrobiota bacterium]MCF7903396.1 KamA family radical SAM protein [Candidatus Neomarinimicrobiota bacterium]